MEKFMNEENEQDKGIRCQVKEEPAAKVQRREMENTLKQMENQ
jgi:hypothetical protein